MADPNTNDPTQDPWAVVSQTPAPQVAAPTQALTAAPAAPQDPWAVVSQVPAPPPGALSRTGAGVLQGVQEVTAPVTPQDHKEELVSFLGGPGALVAYKAGKSLVQSVENIVKPQQTPAPNAPSPYQQAVQDFHKTVQQFRNRDYRNAASSTVSTGADLFSTMPGPGEVLGPQVKDVSEGLRPGADLATPLARDITKDVLLGSSVVAPELAEGEEAAATTPKVKPRRIKAMWGGL